MIYRKSLRNRLIDILYLPKSKSETNLSRRLSWDEGQFSLESFLEGISKLFSNLVCLFSPHTILIISQDAQESIDPESTQISLRCRIGFASTQKMGIAQNTFDRICKLSTIRTINRWKWLPADPDTLHQIVINLNRDEEARWNIKNLVNI